MASALVEQPLHIAWGSGDPAWDDLLDAELPALSGATALVSELGRRTPVSVGFVEPDEAGSIVIPIGLASGGVVQYARYSQVSYTTPYLYVRCNFDNGDAQNMTIREMAMFGGTVVKPDLPPGQQYFTPDDLQDAGLLIAVEIMRPSFARSPSVRESYEFVLPI
jgi:hypothetical protein